MKKGLVVWNQKKREQGWQIVKKKEGEKQVRQLEGKKRKGKKLQLGSFLSAVEHLKESLVQERTKKKRAKKVRSPVGNFG